RSTSVLPLSFRYCSSAPPALHSFPTRRSSDLRAHGANGLDASPHGQRREPRQRRPLRQDGSDLVGAEPATLEQEAQTIHQEGLRSEEHTSELQSRENLVCRLLLEKKKAKMNTA